MSSSKSLHTSVLTLPAILILLPLVLPAPQEFVSKKGLWNQDRKKAMDFSSQESMKEVTCPICQELLTEPMSLDCGHSFCQDCITAHSESGSHLGCECYCPVCQSRYQPWNLRFNWQLAGTLKKFREVDMSSHQRRKSDLCEHHGENCDIFCKDDGKAICRLCVQEHQGHQMSPIMEVVKECQVRPRVGKH